MFVGTSVCGAMPSLEWNIGMCFMMGAAAGGMLPVTYALLAEMMPSKHRGWSLVLVGGLGSVGGYFAASGASALLVPIFSWRILSLLNLPTGLTLVLLGAFIPESAKFLLSRGRNEEGQRVMARFGSKVHALREPKLVGATGPKAVALTGYTFFGKLVALSLAAVCYGLVNFGLLLWLPADMVAKGYSMEVPSRLLAESALIAFPTVFIAALAYSRWSTKWSVVGSIAVLIAGLLGVLNVEFTGVGSPVLPVALMIVGTNALIAMILPYAAESFPPAHPRPDDRHRRRLQQGRWHARAVLRHSRARAAAGAGRGYHRDPDRGCARTGRVVRQRNSRPRLARPRSGRPRLLRRLNPIGKSVRD